MFLANSLGDAGVAGLRRPLTSTGLRKPLHSSERHGVDSEGTAHGFLIYKTDTEIHVYIVYILYMRILYTIVYIVYAELPRQGLDSAVLTFCCSVIQFFMLTLNNLQLTLPGEGGLFVCRNRLCPQEGKQL